MRKESPIEYIEKHKESVDEERLETAIKDLAEPIGGIEYEDSDEVALENGPFVLDFKYDRLEKDSSAIPVARGFALKPAVKDQILKDAVYV